MPIDVIEALDATGEEMVRRVPEHGSGEFVLGAQVIVRESQAAVFFRDGKAYDVFEPGRHTLSMMNIPFLTRAVTDRVFGESPFRAEVYFVNQKVFLNIKWGTRDPIAYRDKELSLIRLRAFGLMSVRVSDPSLFVNKVVGTQGLYVTNAINGLLRGLVVSSLTQTLGEQLETIFELPLRYSDLAIAAKARTFEEFAQYGLELVDLVIDSISPPDEVQKRIDERSGMAAIGDLDRYMKLKTAEALGDAARQPGGSAGAAVGTGAGLGLGVGLAQALGGALQQQPTRPDAAIAAQACTSCNAAVPVGAKFCPECGTATSATPSCAKCGSPLGRGAKFCAECGTAAQ